MTEEQRKSINERFEAAKKSPSAFIENIFNIDLLPYQKILIDNTIFEDFRLIPRMQNKKYNTYLYLLCNYIEMKDDDVIVIARSDKIEELNKDEFLKFLWK